MAGTTTRIAVNSQGVPGGVASRIPHISSNGRYVTFISYSDLVADDTNGGDDVFVRDLLTGITTRASIDSNERQVSPTGLESFYYPVISDDGRYVAFVSEEALVADDRNSRPDVYLRDRVAGTTTRVSIGANGEDPQYYLETLSPIDMSGNGRFIAFSSAASNLVPGDRNERTDIFVRDRLTNTLTAVSTDSNGNLGLGSASNPAISDDGRFVAFESLANLVPGDRLIEYKIFVKDRLTGQTTLVSVDSSGNQGVTRNYNRTPGSFNPAISADGRFVAFESTAVNLVPGDTNGAPDVFVHDRQTRQTTRVSVSANGTQSNGFSGEPSISADGRYVTFTSTANNLVPGDNNNAQDIFIHDRVAGTTAIVSLSSEGNQTEAGSISYSSSVSGDGRFIVFESGAKNLVNDGIQTFFEDIYLRDTRPTPSSPDGATDRNDRITGTNRNDGLVGLGGNDTITGGRGNDRLTGGQGRDRFVYTRIQDRFDRITDFQPGQDKIDLSKLLDSIGYRGRNPLGDRTMRLVGQGNTRIDIDANGRRGGGVRSLVLVEDVSANAMRNPRNFAF